MTQEVSTVHDDIITMLREAPTASPERLFEIIGQVAIVSGYLPAADAVQPVQDLVPFAERLATDNPTNPDYQQRHGWVLVVLAQRLEAAGRRPEAEAPARAAITALLRAAPAAPENLLNDTVHLVAIVSGYLPAADAVQPVQAIVGHARRIVATRPTNPDYRARLVWALEVLASRLMAAGHEEESADALWEANAVKLATHRPAPGFVPSPYIREVPFPANTALVGLSRHPDHMDVFAVASGGQVWDAGWHGHWNDRTMIGTRVFPPATNLAALSRRIGDDDYIEMQIYAIDGDGRVRVAGWHDNEWFDWEQVGNRSFPTGTTLAAIARSFDLINVFAVDGDGDGDGQVWGAGWHGGWIDWTPVGTHRFPATTNIAVISRSPDYINVFAVDGDGQVWGAGWHGGWIDWTPVGTHKFPATTNIAVISRSPDYINVFAVDGDGQVWGAGWHGGWIDWTPVGTHKFPATTNIAVISRSPDYMDVFAVDGDGQVWVAWWHGQWNDWTQLPAPTRPTPDEEIPFGETRVFTLPAPMERPSGVATERESLICATAEVTCHSNGEWEIAAYLENHETEADVTFDLHWSVIGTSRPFGLTLAGDLSAAGHHETIAGSAILGTPPSGRFHRAGNDAALTDPGFWREIFKAASRFDLIPAWDALPEFEEGWEPEPEP